MRPQTFPMAMVMPITLGLMFACHPATRESRDGIKAVTIDLNKTAPIGYEICADPPPHLAHQNVDLKISLPARINIPPAQQKYGAKYIEFRPGEHEVDVYRNLHSARVLWTKGRYDIEESTPTVHVKLPLAKLPKGRYVLGISGDPFFAYCTVDLQ